ncbi:hypothetical protein [Cellulomonas soli]|uniref:hypothetical protein n=1 Tax=Cellulomonas soli TaxID=931535 RepID=UPI0011BE395E|nr:hypothetical protein [Cellulomonas soli]NYI59883.1 hypothetical protein [Cellulomonas soli]
MRRRAVLVLLAVGALAGCTQPEPLVQSDPDFCSRLIAGVADYTDFATAVIGGGEVTAAERDVATGYVESLRAGAPDDQEVVDALEVFTTPYEVDRAAQGQDDTAPEPVDADALSAATSTLLTACSTQ